MYIGKLPQKSFFEWTDVDSETEGSLFGASLEVVAVAVLVRHPGGQVKVLKTRDYDPENEESPAWVSCDSIQWASQ